jgi:DNA-binding SARP family transcriptional activator
MAVRLGPELGGPLGNHLSPARGRVCEGWVGKDKRDGGGMNKQIAIRNDRPGGSAVAGRREPQDFRVLGALEMPIGEIGSDQERRLLVALLSARGMPVTHGRLMEAIWDDVPDGALDALYHLVRDLRKRLAAAGLAGVLIAANGTYRLNIAADRVDVHRFHALTSRVRDLGEGDDEQAVALLEEALGLHRGEPLAGLRGRWIGGYRHLLIEERRAAELALYEAAIRAGQSRERIAGLDRLFRDRPGDEWVAWLYMHALYRAGRQGDALEVWHAVTRHLDSTIAAASLKALSDLYESILRQDDDLLRPEAVSFPVGETGTRARAAQ